MLPKASPLASRKDFQGGAGRPRQLGSPNQKPTLGRSALFPSGALRISQTPVFDADVKSVFRQREAVLPVTRNHAQPDHELG